MSATGRMLDDLAKRLSALEQGGVAFSGNSSDVEQQFSNELAEVRSSLDELWFEVENIKEKLADL